MCYCVYIDEQLCVCVAVSFSVLLCVLCVCMRCCVLCVMCLLCVPVCAVCFSVLCCVCVLCCVSVLHVSCSGRFYCTVNSQLRRRHYISLQIPLLIL